MSEQTSSIISKVWGMCGPLRDDGVSYGYYLEQLIYLIDKRPACAETQTKDAWIYDFSTNIHFTLKRNPMHYSDLLHFISCYHLENNYERTET